MGSFSKIYANNRSHCSLFAVYEILNIPEQLVGVEGFSTPHSVLLLFDSWPVN